MKKPLLISILLGSIILAGCGQQKGLSQDELFSKKQECASLQTQIENEIKKSDKFSINIGTIIKERYLTQIFYSEKRNSCLYETSEIYQITNGETICDGLTTYANKRLYDFYAKELIFDKKGCFGEEEYDELLKELKGE